MNVSDTAGSQLRLERGGRHGLVVRKNVLLEMKQGQRGEKSKRRKKHLKASL